MKREIELQIVCGIRTFTLDGEEYAHLGDLAKFLENREKIRQTYTITAIGKPYGFSAYKLNQYLINKHIQYRKRNVCHIYQKYAKKGYVKSVSGAKKRLICIGLLMVRILLKSSLLKTVTLKHLN